MTYIRPLQSCPSKERRGLWWWEPPGVRAEHASLQSYGTCPLKGPGIGKVLFPLSVKLWAHLVSEFVRRSVPLHLGTLAGFVAMLSHCHFPASQTALFKPSVTTSQCAIKSI